MSTLFADRRDAGRQLAVRLYSYAGRHDVLVLGLPRGGVPVAYEVALALDAPLDVFLVRKLGVPGREELAMGAIASGGVRVLNPEVIAALRITQQALDAVTAHEEQELRRRERLFRGERPPFDVAGRTIILVDDGMATGSTARAAIAALRGQQPASIVVAVPVAPPSTCQMLAHEADHLECLLAPEPFLAVGQWYQDFSETTDADVRSLLDAAARRSHDVLGGQADRMGADGDELEWS